MDLTTGPTIKINFASSIYIPNFWVRRLFTYRTLFLTMEPKNYQADVIVVGGGLAGITTALELLNGGRAVLLLDRDVEEEFGGLANWAFGGMFFVNFSK